MMRVLVLGLRTSKKRYDVLVVYIYMVILTTPGNLDSQIPKFHGTAVNLIAIEIRLDLNPAKDEIRHTNANHAAMWLVACRN